MSRVIRRAVLITAGVAATTAAVVLAPHALRRLDTFRVERVEVVGSRFVAPHAVLEASGIARTANVFDDTDPWRRALLEHPVIEDVRIERRLPDVLVLRVTEVEPLALVRTPELRMVDAAGSVLPVDPAGFDVDLPVVAAESAVAPDGRLAAGPAARLVEALARVRRFEPAIAARVSEVGWAGGGAVRLVLDAPTDAEVLIPGDVSRPRLRALRLTLADLARRRDLTQMRRVDLRFRDQVVVSLTSSGAS